MSRSPVRHTCGAYHSPKHRPHCTPEYRREEGCWCFLYNDRITAREWRAQRRKVARQVRTREWHMLPPLPTVASWAGLL